MSEELLKIDGVVFSLEHCEKIGRELATKGCTRDAIEKAMADRPYAKRRIFFFYDEELQERGLLP